MTPSKPLQMIPHSPGESWYDGISDRSSAAGRWVARMSQSSPAPVPSATTRRVAKVAYWLVAPFVFYYLFYALSFGTLVLGFLPLPPAVQTVLGLAILCLSAFGAGAIVWLGWRSLCSQFEKGAAQQPADSDAP